MMVNQEVLSAPAQLVSETRLAFRREALEHVERAASLGGEVVAVDLGNTAQIDASGLGILVLLQKRAKERGISTRLVHASPAVIRLLELTKLTYLFELES